MQKVNLRMVLHYGNLRAQRRMTHKELKEHFFVFESWMEKLNS